jgi:hypothetical protein
MIASHKVQLLGAALLLVAAIPVSAQDYGRRDGEPRDIVEMARQSGGYCDQGGCPNNFWRYRIYYGPVFYHHRWFRGPVYTKDDYGRNFFWINGGWHRDEWHARRPSWARNEYFGPPQSRDFYQANNFGRHDGYGDHGPDGRRDYGDNGRYGPDNGQRGDGYARNPQGYGGQDQRPQYDNRQANGGYGQDQRPQYGNGQSNGQGGGYGQGQRSQYGNGQANGQNNGQGGGYGQDQRSQYGTRSAANGGPTNFTNGMPGQVAAQSPTTANITVTSASYGQSCKAPKGNETQALQAACNGKATCQYTVDYKVIGDPAPGCGKDFDVAWTCATGPGGSASLPAEANGGKLNLSCPATR